jgi:hypothetical protein
MLQSCFYCHYTATKLCDGKGCDRPLCDIHAFTARSFHVCIRGKGQRGSRTHTVDYCPDCRPHKEPA